ncbi:MAG: NAD(P)/FAD-dependent oxidoreductase [Actinomycetota bacterium]
MDMEIDQSTGPVIVVGAGAAGLAAARVLRDHGREVVVLEGRARIGGRTSTVEVEGARVDEGAAWIDGHKTNPLMELSRRAGLETARADYVDPFRVAAYDTARGRWIGRFESLRHVVAVAQAAERLARPDTTGAANLGGRIERDSGRRGRGGAASRVRRFLLRSSAETNWADRADELGAHAAEIGIVYGGREAVVVGGYGRLVDLMAQGLDIRLDHVVGTIGHRDDGVEVVTSKGPFEGSHVIVTVPLGVLKADAITFEPPLPDAKVAAIDGIGMGRLEKVVLRFDQPFWRRDPTRPQNLFFIDDATPCPLFFDLGDGAGHPFLAALVTGDHGTRLVNDPDSVVAEAMQALETMFPGRVPTPVATHTTRWQLDPFSLGSYSTIRPETTEEHFDDLVAPVGTRLLFAGEATNKARPGYVDGAIDSGLREAGRILGHEVALDLSSRIARVG